MSGRRDQRGELAPLLVFGLLSLVVVALGVGVVVTRGGGERGEPAASPSGTALEADHQLTDAEAIARFKELDALRIDALEERDLNALRLLYTPNSPDLGRGRTTIRKLRQDQVFVDELWELVEAEVLRNDRSEIDLEVVGISDVRFFSRTGAEVTQHARKERQTVHCALKFLQGEWLLHKCTIVRAEPVRQA